MKRSSQRSISHITLARALASKSALRALPLREAITESKHRPRDWLVAFIYVPDASSELGLPESRLGASAVVADQIQALRVFGGRAVAVEELAGADGELVGGVLGVLEPDQHVLVGVVQGARVVGLDAEVQGLDAGDAAVHVGGLRLELCAAETGLSVCRRRCEYRAVVDKDFNGLRGRIVEEGALGRGREGKSVCPGQVGTDNIVLVVGQTAVNEAPAISGTGDAAVEEDGAGDVLCVVGPEERRVQVSTVSQTLHSSRSSFKVRTARPDAERPVRSLNIDREIGLSPSFTYRPAATTEAMLASMSQYMLVGF